MKGYKAFNHDMTCRGKQYAENTVFEEDKAEICKSGMHFCSNPLDCLNYYPLIDNDGNVVTIAEVEALDEVKTNDNKKFCTKKLHVGTNVGLKGIADIFIGLIKEETKIESGGDDAQQVGGDDAILINGVGSKFNAGIRSIVVCYEYRNGMLQEPVVIRIDGEKYKPNVWYKLKNGVITEVAE